MDTLRGNFDSSDVSNDAQDYDVTEDDAGRDLPPASIGQDERRMQVRAYNFWAGLLDNRNFPSIEDLDPANLDDFGPYSVLLDFSVGIEDPAVQFLGAELGKECRGEGEIKRLSDVPPRSLLSRITDHYLQILANQAPIGFEAEFVNLAGNTVLYRGILLPFSSDDDTIDFIYGVINWKEMASAAAADELLLEIDQALAIDETGHDEAEGSVQQAAEPVAEWADGPGAEADDGTEAHQFASDIYGNVEPLELSDEVEFGEDDELPAPAFGNYSLDDEEDEEYEEEDEEDANYSFASLTDHIKAPKNKAPAIDFDDYQPQVDYDPTSFDVDPAFEGDDAEAGSSDGAPIPVAYEPETVESFEDVASFELDSPREQDAVADAGFTPEAEEEFGEVFDEAESDAELPADASLYDCLASARELAQAARSSEDRSRSALYAAVGRAYDFSLAAQEAPEDFAELVEENGLSVQERAPMTPVVKLVFGADYDKTRLTEYAAVLAHAHRAGIARGSLAGYLAGVDGGLKGIVQAERRLRAEESGKEVAPRDGLRSALAKKLRNLDAGSFEDLAVDGPEFALVMIRRTEEGKIVVLGEVSDDIPLIERVARKIAG
ncbi:MAG: hypothetical protein EP350_10080 [Alphaproteobacteria bacterium]|nr:MAG: hypothetical protein EP350_10080 [Alphaproteobacteria bacterium]